MQRSARSSFGQRNVVHSRLLRQDERYGLDDSTSRAQGGAASRRSATTRGSPGGLRGRVDRGADRSSPNVVHIRSEDRRARAATVDLVVANATFEPFNSASKTAGDNASSTQPKPCVSYINTRNSGLEIRADMRALGRQSDGRAGHPGAQSLRSRLAWSIGTSWRCSDLGEMSLQSVVRLTFGGLLMRRRADATRRRRGSGRCARVVKPAACSAQADQLAQR